MVCDHVWVATVNLRFITKMEQMVWHSANSRVHLRYLMEDDERHNTPTAF